MKSQIFSNSNFIEALRCEPRTLNCRPSTLCITSSQKSYQFYGYCERNLGFSYTSKQIFSFWLIEQHGYWTSFLLRPSTREIFERLSNDSVSRIRDKCFQSRFYRAYRVAQKPLRTFTIASLRILDTTKKYLVAVHMHVLKLQTVKKLDI